MQVTLTVCDVCERGDGTQPVQVTLRGKAAKLDLCPEHLAPLEELLAGVKPPTPTRKGGRRPRVTTVEEIEASKTK